MPPELSIIHAHPRYVVVAKPGGMLSVPGKGPEKQDCVAARVRREFSAASGPLIVHRLDMETSGLMVLGLDADAQRDLSMQFEQRRVSKRYLALLEGIVSADSGEVSLPLRPDIERRPIQIVDFEHGNDAITRWRVLSREIDRTRIEFEPLTGKTHQLRVHAATPPGSLRRPDGSITGGLGHAILGDTLYGEANSAPRLMLHASYLAFTEPGGGWVEFRSSPEF